MVTAPQRYPVFFREQDLPRAYAFANELERPLPVAETIPAAPVAETIPAAPVAEGDDPIPGWSLQQVERAYLESPKGMWLIFDGMIDHPDQVLTSEDLAGFLTHKPNADSTVVRGTMGAFANRCLQRYKRGPQDFPFEHWYVDGGFARYRMPASVADVLRPLRDR